MIVRLIPRGPHEDGQSHTARELSRMVSAQRSEIMDLKSQVVGLQEVIARLLGQLQAHNQEGEDRE